MASRLILPQYELFEPENRGVISFFIDELEVEKCDSRVQEQQTKKHLLARVGVIPVYGNNPHRSGFEGP